MSAAPRMTRPLLAALATAVLAAPAAAADVAKGDLTLVAPQMRASLGRAPTTAGYVTIRNAGARGDRLVAASCACAERVELHGHRLEKGVASMTRLRAIDVPARGRAVLAPGGAHLMFIGLKGRVADGAQQPVTLVFERAGRVTVRFQARARIDTAGSGAQQHHHAR